jgi:uncharacterized membrane protein YidH (DUF202 family)
MKIFISILALLNGGFMLLDGIYVLLKGKYIGPEKPGPWANIFYKLKVNVFQLGPLFIVFGMLWLVWLYALWTQQSWAYTYGFVISIATLWYMPVGTLFCLVIICVLLFYKNSLFA